VRRFLRTNIISAVGAGFAPYLSVYAIVVLKQDAAYAILMAAIGSAAALVGAILIGNWLERGSASRLYRISLVVRGVGMASSALAGPWNPYAPIVLLVVIVIITVGFAAGMLSAQERVLRLAAPGESIRAQSAYGATTAGALAAGQLAGVVVLALLPVTYLTYVGIFIVTGAFRLVAAATADVGDDWNTATRIHHGEEMPAEPAFESQR
jgi:MFS family permease